MKKSVTLLAITALALVACKKKETTEVTHENGTTTVTKTDSLVTPSANEVVHDMKEGAHNAGKAAENALDKTEAKELEKDIKNATDGDGILTSKQIIV